jgi:hypothetical protein
MDYFLSDTHFIVWSRVREFEIMQTLVYKAMQGFKLINYSDCFCTSKVSL